MLFFWEDLERQIRIEGAVVKASEAVSDEVFHARPVASRVAAVTSSQSEPISSREELDARYEQNVQRYSGNPPSRPATWGAFVLKPSLIEFWQGGKNRLHDRFEYRLENALWIVRRLQP
jgi:pyridoxamine 5'-phosphate oxidase